MEIKQEKLEEVVFDPTRGFVYVKSSGKFLGKPARDYNGLRTVMNSAGQTWRMLYGYIDGSTFIPYVSSNVIGKSLIFPIT